MKITNHTQIDKNKTKGFVKKNSRCIWECQKKNECISCWLTMSVRDSSRKWQKDNSELYFNEANHRVRYVEWSSWEDHIL